MSTSETGHAKNVANFQELVNYVIAYGPAYNPSRESIRVTALQELLTNAQKGIVDFDTALSPYSMASAERQTAFEPLNKLSTRLLNALKATDTTSNVDDTAQTLVRKIKGERAANPKTADTAPTEGNTDPGTKQISVAQTSFDNRLENFYKLIIHLQNIPQFKPNETELKPETLLALYDTMNTKNNQAKQAGVALSNARIARNKILYEPLTGLFDIAFDTKSYIKSLFGASSPEFKQVSKIEFKSNK